MAEVIKMTKVDMEKARAEAEREIREERVDSAKNRIKKKMRELEDANTVVANIERDLKDLYNEIEDGN